MSLPLVVTMHSMNKYGWICNGIFIWLFTQKTILSSRIVYYHTDFPSLYISFSDAFFKMTELFSLKTISNKQYHFNTNDGITNFSFLYLQETRQFSNYALYSDCIYTIIQYSNSLYSLHVKSVSKRIVALSTRYLFECFLQVNLEYLNDDQIQSNQLTSIPLVQFNQNFIPSKVIQPICRNTFFPNTSLVRDGRSTDKRDMIGRRLFIVSVVVK